MSRVRCPKEPVHDATEKNKINARIVFVERRKELFASSTRSWRIDGAIERIDSKLKKRRRCHNRAMSARPCGVDVATSAYSRR